MPTKPTDVTGLRFGRLIAISPADMRGRERRWRCQCDCGAVTFVAKSKLRSGHTRSCGCFNSERASARFLKHGHSRTARSVTPTYAVWENMLHRCRHHPEYFGRGITFDPRWRDFRNFLADMGERPEGLTIDRIDNDGDYTKDNCRWTTYSVQNSNQRPRRDRTSRHGNARLTDAQVTAIIEDCRAHQRIADDYSVSRSLVSRIKRGELHKHVGPHNQVAL